MSEMTEHPDPKVYWKHRRKGYYIGLVWAILQTFLWIGIELNTPDTIQNMGVVIGWSYGLSVSLIVAYYSNTAVEEFLRNRNP